MKMRPILFILPLAVVITGCSEPMNRTTGGVLTGGTLGAGLGAIIGSATGDAGPGIAIGAAVGSLAGALVGNSMDNQAAANEEMQERLNRQQATISENERLIAELKARGADARMTDRGVVVNLPDILFDFGSARLTGQAERSLSEISSVLKKREFNRISVEGHTDSIGSDETNHNLSERRAANVARELTSQGIPSSDIRVRGYGESRPIASNSDSAGRARNRRVEIIVGK